ncbi:acylneuraminate cytidylyltransferase [Clostridium sp. SYSU_GA19001]|uniref:acylneuraminate cytidylyltransferase n=1 Tax=Clostridium caldaquaticum TaxID=2940653 RepID=UPI00207710EE|nr:acylneuraminate cytidylyltransferase [Clostridium caldaquaticum]MCM8711379.1 acylneuraminate cytidylyltransferase [Clostridium caldaquaticum]
MNVAFIPVRGGSKSIPLKNVKIINGRPLIYWTLDAAIGCEDIDEVIVATDSEKIKQVVNNYNSPKIKIVGRSEETSTDTASTESVMLEFSYRYSFDNIVLIQATSPLLTSEDLSRGLKKFKENNIDSVLSVVRQKRFIWSEINRIARPMNYDYLNRPRRQEFEGFLVENGAFYITSRERLLNSKCRISGNIGLVEMNEDTYFEIDEPSDWIIIEELLKVKKGENLHKFDLNNIKMLITDSDGVLTDGGMYYSENGDELKKFNTKDGMGFQLLREKGIKTGIITGENRKLVENRAVKMKIDELHMGISNKLEVINNICKKYNISLNEIAYIGDDINDIEVIEAVGFGCCVNDAMQLVKETAKYITKANGGQGAVREVAELILMHKN